MMRLAFAAVLLGSVLVAQQPPKLVVLCSVDQLAAWVTRLLEVAAKACARVRAVMTAFPADDLREDYAHPDPIRRALANALASQRAGDVQFVLQPYWLNSATPASHGSPHAYDREVVGFAMGPGIPNGVRLALPITPGFGAVLFAKMLHIPKPTAAHETVPAGFFDLR